jgi:hypothetical protein
MEWANKHRLELDSLGDDAVQNSDGSFSVPDASASQKFTDSKEDVTNDLIYADGHTALGSGTLVDYRASWTKGIDRFPYGYSFTFTDPNDIALTYSNIADPSHPRFAVNDGTVLSDPSLYPFDKGDNGPSVNWDEEFAGVMNFTLPLPLIGHDGTLKFGGSLRARQRHAIAAAAETRCRSAPSITDRPPGMSTARCAPSWAMNVTWTMRTPPLPAHEARGGAAVLDRTQECAFDMFRPMPGARPLALARDTLRKS